MDIVLGKPVITVSKNPSYSHPEVLRLFRISKQKELAGLQVGHNFWTEIPLPVFGGNIHGFLYVQATEIITHDGFTRLVTWKANSYSGDIRIYPRNPERSSIFQVKDIQKLENLILT